MPAIIDIHAHYVSPDLVAEAELNGQKYGVSVERAAAGPRLVMPGGVTLRPIFPELCDLSLRVPMLDAAGVTRQLISTWTDMSGDMLTPDQGARWARLQNDTLAQAAGLQPQMFEAMATLPMQDATLAIEELRYAVLTLGLRSVEMGTNINGRDLDHPSLRPLWRAIRDLDVFVLLHPPLTPVGAARTADYFLNNLVAYPTDTTIAAARLIFSGLMSDLPGLKCCLAHGGGFLPYQIGRMQRGYEANPVCRKTLPHPPKQMLNLFYYDTLTHEDAALEFLSRSVARERLLYGSDYPFEMVDLQGPRRVERLAGASQEQIRAILGGNAEMVLRGIAPATRQRATAS